MAAQELIIYCAQKLCCTVGDDILLWVSDPSLLAINAGVPDPANYSYMVAAEITEDICINATTNQYTVEYDDSVLVDPGTPLVFEDLKTYCCGSCYKQYIDEQIVNVTVTATVSTDATITGDGSVPTPLSIVPSTDADNQLTLGTDGQLFVPFPTIVSDDTLAGDGTAGDPLSLEFSTDVGNRATLGSDSKLWVPPALTSVATDDTIDGLGTVGDELTVVPSLDADNQLALGTDGQLFVPFPTIFTNDTIDGDGTLGNPFLVPPSLDADNRITLGSDGQLYVEDIQTDSTIDGDGSTATPLSITPSTDANNQLTTGSDGQLFIEPTVSTDTTLSGDGSVASPLSVAAPYLLAVSSDDTIDGDGTAGDPLTVTPSTDANNQIELGTDGQLFVAPKNLLAVLRITANQLLDTTHHQIFADTDGGAITVTLPLAPEVGQEYRIVNTGSSANDVEIDGNGNNVVGTAVNQFVSDGESLVLVYETTEGWW